jgi:hypothetical protein
MLVVVLGLMAFSMATFNILATLFFTPLGIIAILAAGAVLLLQPA